MLHTLRFTTLLRSREGIVATAAFLTLAAYLLMRFPSGPAVLAQDATAQGSAADKKPADGASARFSPYVDEKGNILFPKDFETEFVHIGTVAVAPKPGEPVNEIHGTYTRKEDLVAFRRDGRFPDGAVLVKDIRSTTNSKLTTGHAAYGAAIKVWFVMIKDAKGRFPDNDLWGDGWGWGLFEGKDRTKQVAVNYATECRSCHVPAKKSDWVYTQCYPALIEAPKTTASAEPSND